MCWVYYYQLNNFRSLAILVQTTIGFSKPGVRMGTRSHGTFLPVIQNAGIAFVIEEYASNLGSVIRQVGDCVLVAQRHFAANMRQGRRQQEAKRLAPVGFVSDFLTNPTGNLGLESYSIPGALNTTFSIILWSVILGPQQC